MFNKEFESLSAHEKNSLAEIRNNIVVSFEAIINWEVLNLNTKNKDFPFSDEFLERVSFAIPANKAFVEPGVYIKSALKPLKQESWHDGMLDSVYYKWELHYLPLEEVFELFKDVKRQWDKERSQ